MAETPQIEKPSISGNKKAARFAQAGFCHSKKNRGIGVPMGYWPLLIVSGNATSLSHLEPFEFQCLARDHVQPITLNVRFNDHCFTTSFDPTKHDPLDIVPTMLVSKAEKRIFCPDRYSLSFHLPELIKTFGSKRISSTRDGNLVRVESPDGQTYAIFFTLRKQSAARLNLFVVNAYPIQPGKKVADTGEMKFDIALAKILRGEKANFRTDKTKKGSRRNPFKYLATAWISRIARGPI